MAAQRRLDDELIKDFALNGAGLDGFVAQQLDAQSAYDQAS